LTYREMADRANYSVTGCRRCCRAAVVSGAGVPGRLRGWSAGEGLRSLGDGESDSGASRTARHDLLLINLKLAQQIGPSFHLLRRIWSLSIRDQSGLPFRARYVADLRAVQSWSTPSSIGRSTWAAPGPITWLTGLLVLVVPLPLGL
jgi:hypothetical protein